MGSFQEKYEDCYLSSGATRSKLSKGRRVDEPPCSIRTAFQRDRDRIIHSKAFRRLKHKTQVFIAPEGDHYRTRLTHTLEVSQIARTVARALRMNEDLTEAVALGHDLGHTPFGHAGEELLNEIHPGGFCHNHQSLRVVDHLEQLNLTWEVRDGILNHTGSAMPATPEGQIVRISDQIAYVNHDIDDAIRAQVLTADQLPAECVKVLGSTTSARINSLVCAVVEQSRDWGKITLGEEMEQVLAELRSFMFAHVYIGSTPKLEEGKAKQVLEQLYRHFLANPHLVPAKLMEQADAAQAICDYIAGMTDRYVLALYRRHFLPTPWQIQEQV